MSAPLDMLDSFRRDVKAELPTVVEILLKRQTWTVPQVRAVACRLAQSSPDEALTILEGVRKFEVGR